MAITSAPPRAIGFGSVPVSPDHCALVSKYQWSVSCGAENASPKPTHGVGGS